METLGQRIWNTKGKLSLRKLSKSAHISASAMTRICNGDRPPKLHEIHKIARALNTTPSNLIKGTTAQDIAWGASAPAVLERLLIEADERAANADSEAKISFARLRAEVKSGERYRSQELEETIHVLVFQIKDLQFANHRAMDVNSDLSNIILALQEEVMEARKEHRYAVAITRRFVDALTEEDPSQAPLFVGLLKKLEPTLHVKEETNEVDNDKGHGLPQDYSVFNPIDTGCAGRNDGNRLCAEGSRERPTEGIPDGLQGDSDLC